MIQDPVLNMALDISSVLGDELSTDNISGMNLEVNPFRLRELRIEKVQSTELHWVPLKSLEAIIDEKIKMLFIDYLPLETSADLDAETIEENHKECQKILEKGEKKLKFNRPNLNHLQNQISRVIEFKGMFKLVKCQEDLDDEKKQKELLKKNSGDRIITKLQKKEKQKLYKIDEESEDDTSSSQMLRDLEEKDIGDKLGLKALE